MVSRYQHRVSYRFPQQPASKPTSARLFRNDFVAAAFVAELKAQGAQIVAVERREYTVSPWQPYDLGGAK